MACEFIVNESHVKKVMRTNANTFTCTLLITNISNAGMFIKIFPLLLSAEWHVMLHMLLLHPATHLPHTTTMTIKAQDQELRIHYLAVATSICRVSGHNSTLFT